LCRGVVAACISGTGKTYGFQPLVLVVKRFCKDNLLRASKPSTVFGVEWERIGVFGRDEGVETGMFSERSWGRRVFQFTVA
jgi:hypothetical protein